MLEAERMVERNKKAEKNNSNQKKEARSDSVFM